MTVARTAPCACSVSVTSNTGWKLATVTGLLMVFPFGWSPCITANDRPELPEQFNEAYRWYGGLAFPDLTTMPFVKISLQMLGDVEEEHFAYAFVLHEVQGTRSVLTTDLRLLAVNEYSGDASRVVIQEEQFDVFVRPLLENPDERSGTSSETFWRLTTGLQLETISAGTELNPAAIDFVLACACLEKSLKEPGTMLAQRAVVQQMHLAKSRRLRDSLSLHFGAVFLNRALLELANPATPRERVLARLESLLHNRFDYPEDRQDDLERIVTILRKMVAVENLKWSRSTTASSGKPTPEELAACLCDQFGDVRGTHQFFYCADVQKAAWVVTPGEQLLTIGDGAVPALINVVDDERLTRVVGLRNHHGPAEWTPLTEGECACEVLANIWNDWPSDWEEWPKQETEERLRRFWEASRPELKTPRDSRSSPDVRRIDPAPN